MFLTSALEGERQEAVWVSRLLGLWQCYGRHRKLTMDINNAFKMTESHRKRDMFIRNFLCNLPFHKRTLSIQGANMPFH
jgi:hypothetical protein